MSDSTSTIQYRGALKLLEAGRLEEAVALARQLYRDFPGWAGSHKLLGILNLKTGKPAQAEAAWRKTLALDPADGQTLFNLLQLLRQKHPDAHDGLALCRQHLPQTKPDAELLSLAARLYLEAGQLDEALGLLARLTELKPQSNWAVKLAQPCETRQPERALAWYRRVRTQTPENTGVLEALARLALQARDAAEALSCWQQLVQLEANGRRLCNLGAVQLLLRQEAEAEASFRRALEIEPELWQAHQQLGLRLLARQDYAAALPHLQAALPKAPELARELYSLGCKLNLQGQVLLAESFLELCCTVPEQLPDPLHTVYARRAGGFLHHKDYLSARRMYDLAIAHAPQPLLYAWPRLLALPQMPSSLAHLQQERAAFEAGLQTMISEIDAALARKEDLIPLLDTIKPPFTLAYQGCSNKDVMEQLGQCWTRILAAGGSLYRSSHQPQAGRRIRIGIVSRFFRQHSVLIAYGQMICNLAADPDFEVTCIYLGTQVDNKTLWLKSQVPSFLHLPGELSPQSILDLELDILYYTDIGMDKKSYSLALHRLAPIQCVISGHPNTTGLPEMDYYISDLLLEPENAPSQYSETLIRLQQGFMQIDPPQAPERVASRSELGLSESAHVYFCPMTLFKLHPDFDAALAGILRADPQGELYLVSHYDSLLTGQLRQRLAEGQPDIAERVHFLPWMSLQDFFSTILQADVVLDSFHFGGGTTSRMVLAQGQPYVSWPGEFLRGRMTYGCYRRMGLEEHLPKSQEAYVAEAVKLGTDPDYRRQMQALIVANNAKLFPLTKQNPASYHGLKQALRLMVEHYPEKISEAMLY
ncbi:MAG: tetratricopeptide repeat protein [Candidatus Sericytochromatia bacterium]